MRIHRKTPLSSLTVGQLIDYITRQNKPKPPKPPKPKPEAKPPRIVFGCSWENFNHAPAAGMKALADIGFSFVRCWIFWNSANPKPGVFDWSKVDADIAAIRGAGLKVYANMLWAPEWAAEGQKTYLPYNDGCTEWVDPNDGSKGIKFAESRPYCTKPAHIDPNAVREFARALAERHGDAISWYSAWNEPGGEFYWPAWRSDGPEEGIRRLREEVLLPFTEGIFAARPAAEFAGPEADAEGVLDQVLQQERKGIPLFDAISIHPYSWGKFPEDSYKRLDDLFMPIANARRFGRPIWLSEIGDDGTGRIIEWTREVIKRDISLICYHDPRQWFEEGTWESGAYVENEKAKEMREIIAGIV